MRILSFNANGIRSAANKGFFDWLQGRTRTSSACRKPRRRNTSSPIRCSGPTGYHCFYRDATTKKGYSGVAIYARSEPDEVRTALGWAPFDDEGRYIEARFGKLSVVSLYMPSGSSGDERQDFKFDVMDWLSRSSTNGSPAAATTCCAATGTSCARATTSRTGLEPEEFRLPAAGTRVAQRTDRRRLRRRHAGSEKGLERQLPRRQARCGRIHLVVATRRGAREQRRLAHRLPDRHAVAARPRVKGCFVTPSPRFSDHAPYTVDYAE